MLHVPVLLEDSIEYLVQDINGSYIDCTYGRGGHTKLILENISINASLSSFDKDPEAVKYAEKNKQDNFRIIHDSFCNIDKYFEESSVDGIIYDLGTCSTHLDNPERGFSFNKDGPLDMRFDNTSGQKLSEWINTASKVDIMSILYKYGDEKHAKLISSAIDTERKDKPILRTSQLGELIKKIYPEKNTKNHPATKSFQAFRIHINNELKEFEKSLLAATKIIKTKGIIVTIAFHSLEDNIIKSFFKPTIKSFPKDIPINNEKTEQFRCLAKKIRPEKRRDFSKPKIKKCNHESFSEKMTIPKEFIYIGMLCFLIVFLGFEKIKLSWEISTLHNNFENLQIEYDNLKDLNLKLITQFHIENSPASVEKIAKEKLGMEKKRPKKLTINDE